MLAAIGWGALWLESRGYGRRISGVVMGILGGMLFANLGVLPFHSPVYDFVWSHILLFGLALLLLQADLRRIFRETGRLMGAYLAGATGTLLGAITAYFLFSGMPHAAELSGVFAASYIGGSVNFVATAAALGMDEFREVQAGALAADNLVMATYFILLFSLPGIPILQRIFARGTPAASVRKEPVPEPNAQTEEGPFRSTDLLLLLALAAGICYLGQVLGGLTAFDGAAILWTTALAVTVATSAAPFLRRIRGVQSTGMALLQLVFVVIGAGASLAGVLEVGVMVVLFLGVILTIHLLFLLGAGWLMGFDLRELAAVSNANCGGPTTAAAMAAVKGWHSMVAPLVLCGIFGYVIANFVGVALGKALGGG